MAQKIDQVKLLGPSECSGVWSLLDIGRREQDRTTAEFYANDHEIASDALGYDVAPGEYDIDEAAAEIMRLAGGWR